MNETCGNCRHFHQFTGEPRGSCFFNPPIVFTSGFTGRPTVTIKEPGCGQHDASAPPAVLGKTNGDTPGHAAKLAREMKRK